MAFTEILVGFIISNINLMDYSKKPIITSAEFKAWFGNWEKKKKIKKLLLEKSTILSNVTPFCELPIESISDHKLTKNFFNEKFNNTTIINYDYGTEIGVSNKAVGKILSHNAQKIYHRYLNYINHIIKESVFVDFSINNHHNKIEIPLYLYFIIGIVDLDGKEKTIKLTVEKTRRHGHKLYDMVLYEKTKTELISETQVSNLEALINSALQYKDNRLFEILQTNNVNISQSIDNQGVPIVLYHATSKDFNIFKNESTAYYFAENPHYASGLIHGNMEVRPLKGQSVIPAYLKITKLKKVDFDINHENVNRYLNSFEYLRDLPDGLLGKDAGSHENVWVVFKPNQIKSAIGNKTFDPNNDSIRFETGGKIPTNDFDFFELLFGFKL